MALLAGDGLERELRRLRGNAATVHTQKDNGECVKEGGVMYQPALRLDHIRALYMMALNAKKPPGKEISPVALPQLVKAHKA